jgi:pimeloyl-ACP methyl ester carboxylesterase
VECSEDAPFTTANAITGSVQVLPASIRSAAKASTLASFNGCATWAVESLDSAQKEPVTSSTPTLLLAGEYDPITPPSNATLVAGTLSTSYTFVFPGTGHWVGLSHPCPLSIVQEFYDHPQQKPDASCIASMKEPFK